MLANGFKIKEGQDDLMPYVYAAARAIENAVNLNDYYQLCPKSPSEKMQEIGCEAMPTMDAQPWDAAQVYQAMLNQARLEE